MHSMLFFLSACLIAFLSGCQSSGETTIDQTLAAKSRKPKTYPRGNYTTNPALGNAVQVILTATGDTLKTGTPISATPARPEAGLPPKITKVKTENVQQVVTQTNVKPLGKPQKRSFKTSTTPQAHDFVLVNSTGDTIPTGKAIPIKAKALEVSFPTPVRASSMRFRDNAIYHLQYLGQDQGLHSGSIYDVLKDSRKNLWLATADGLTRYDGTFISHFSVKDGFPATEIRALYEDRDGNIWVATYGSGLIYYDGRNFFQITEDEGLGSNHVFSVGEDEAGNIWVGTESAGLVCYDGKYLTHFTPKEGLPSPFIWKVLPSSGNKLWIGTFGAGLLQFDGKQFIQYQLKGENTYGNRIYSMKETQNGSLWFGTKQGLHFLDLQQGALTSYDSRQGLSSNVVLTLAEDAKNRLWAGTLSGGVNIINDSSIIHLTENQGLVNDVVWSIKHDAEGHLWMGTEGGGLAKFTLNSFQHLTKSEGLNNDIISAVMETREKDLWLGTFGKGAIRYSNNTLTYFPPESGLTGNIIYALHEDTRGKLWFGSWGNGVIAFDGSTFRQYQKEQGLVHNYVLCILEDRQGNLWFGTRGGLSRFDGERFTNYTQESGLSDNIIYALHEDTHGNIWMGTNQGGLTRFDGKSFLHYSEKEGLPSNTVKAIIETPDQALWIGTDQGVTRFDGQNWTSYNEEHGLASNDIWSLKAIRGEQLWVGTKAGLTRIDLQNTDHLTSFSRQDGLKGNNFQFGSVWLDHQEVIWWGTDKGVTFYQAETNRTSPTPSAVQLSHIAINNKLFKGETKEKVTFTGTSEFHLIPKGLVLPHNKNHLSFYFQSYFWDNPQKVIYSHRIRELSTQWAQGTAQPFADYRNLLPGSYTFDVRARLIDQTVWGQPTTFSFTITPPWWLSYWAKVTYVLMAGLLIFGYVRWRTYKLKQQREVLQQRVREKTTELQKSNHELSHQKTQTEASIRSALRIQQAMLPFEKRMHLLLKKGYFLIYRPRDIVSGDFYWVERVGEKTYIATADCTGHGVPGAFMSLIGINLLNKIVLQDGVYAPCQILQQLHDQLNTALQREKQQKNRGMHLMDNGMDISILCLEEKNDAFEVRFAGAHRPLYFIREGKVHTVKGTRRSIGGHRRHEVPFTEKKLDLPSGTMLYLGTDGFADQNNAALEKFGSQKLKALLGEISQLQLDQQKARLEDALDQHMMNTPQRDDILWMGIKL